MKNHSTEKNTETDNYTGHFLISDSEQEDPNFVSTVVLIINHDETGAFGLIINRQSGTTLGDAFPHLFDEHVASDIPIFIGGPVKQEYLFLLQEEFPKEPGIVEEISDNLYFVPNVRSFLEDIYNSTEKPNPLEAEHRFRFVAGYSGWESGQLEQEVHDGNWILHSVNTDAVFHPHPEECWTDILRSMGGIYWIMAETGHKPSLN